MDSPFSGVDGLQGDNQGPLFLERPRALGKWTERDQIEKSVNVSKELFQKFQNDQKSESQCRKLNNVDGNL